MVVVFALLALMSFRAAQDPSPAFWLSPPSPFDTILTAALLITTGITLLSGLDYLWKNRTALTRRAGSGAA